MKKIIAPLNIILLGAVCFTIAYYYASKSYEAKFLSGIFAGEYGRFAELSEGANKIVHLPPATGGDGNSMLASPDALFSVMSYDLSEKPVGLYLPLPASPWTVTIYDENCHAFYSLDERNFGSDTLQLILRQGEQAAPGHEGAIAVNSPGKKGMVVTRLIMSDSAEQPALAELRRGMKSGLIKTN